MSDQVIITGMLVGGGLIALRLLLNAGITVGSVKVVGLLHIVFRTDKSDGESP